MRSLRRLALLLGLSAQFACEQPRRGLEPAINARTVVWNMSEQPRFIDPGLNYTIGGGNVIAHVFEGLTNVGTDSEILPGVAERWEVTPDGLTYDFYLRADAKWSDGEPLTAHDFDHAWKRVLDPDFPASYANMFYAVASAEAYNKREITDPSAIGVEVVDDHHLRVHLTRPVPYYLQLTAFATYCPIRRDIIEAHGNAWTHQAETYIGNGAFKMTAYERGHVIEFEPNEHYWNRETVKIDRLIFEIIADLQSDFTAYRTAQLDISYAIPYPEVPNIRQTLAEHLTIQPWIGTYYASYRVDRPPFDDERVRRAFSYCIDRERIAREVTEGLRRPAYSWIPPGVKDADGVTDFEEVSPSYAPNASIEEAQRLLAEAGYPNGQGFPPTIYLFNQSEVHKQVGERLQATWKTVFNVDVELRQLEAQVFFAERDEGNFQVCRSSWFGDYSDPMTFLDMWMSTDGNNDTGYASPAYDALIELARHEPDRERYFALCHEAERMLLEEDVIFAPIFFYSNEFLQNPALEGVEFPATGGTYFHRACWNLDELRAAGIEVDE